MPPMDTMTTPDPSPNEGSSIFSSGEEGMIGWDKRLGVLF